MDDMGDLISIREKYFDNIVNRKSLSNGFISVHEEFVHTHQETIRKIQTFHNINLKEIIFNRLKNLISPKDSISFIVEAYTFGLDGYAIDILNEVAVAQKHVDESDLFDMLKEVATGVSPPQVAVGIHGRKIENSHTSEQKGKTKQPTSIDMDRLNELNKRQASVRIASKTPMFDPDRMKDMFKS